jgi:hypothetical protein
MNLWNALCYSLLMWWPFSTQRRWSYLVVLFLLPAAGGHVYAGATSQRAEK